MQWETGGLWLGCSWPWSCACCPPPPERPARTRLHSTAGRTAALTLPKGHVLRGNWQWSLSNLWREMPQLCHLNTDSVSEWYRFPKDWKLNLLKKMLQAILTHFPKCGSPLPLLKKNIVTNYFQFSHQVSLTCLQHPKEHSWQDGRGAVQVRVIGMTVCNGYTLPMFRLAMEGPSAFHSQARTLKWPLGLYSLIYLYVSIAISFKIDFDITTLVCFTYFKMVWSFQRIYCSSLVWHIMVWD